MSGAWLVILSVVAMAALVYLAALIFGRARTTERVQCEQRNADFEVTFDCRLNGLWEPSRRVDVVRCSAFADPDHPDCAKQCLAPAV
jgi:hypothetical protein